MPDKGLSQQRICFQLTAHFLVTISITEIFVLLGYYAAFIADYLPTFRNNLSVLSSRAKHFLLLEFGRDTLSRNFGK